MTVIILHNSFPWIKVSLRSFSRFFPDSTVLIVDNNLDPGMSGYDHRIEEERNWIKAQCSHDSRYFWGKTESPRKSHGFGIDWAVQWCRDHGIRQMLHIEPDCLIDGVEWANKLLEATEKGAWMAGSHRKSYGPIHPTPSIWDVSQINSSFGEQLRGSDHSHSRFHELVDMKSLEPAMTNAWFREYWTNYWDTAQKPWFDCAIHDKAFLVDESPDFKHFWNGSTHNTDPSKTGDPRVTQYL
jgi:hypothetical protein